MEPHDFEYRFIARDGRVVWLRDIVTVVAENGKPRWLRGVMVDISKQKLIESALREANRLAEDVQQISGLGGWKYDCATEKVTWTREVYRLHGVGEDFDPSDAARHMALYFPEDALRIVDAFKRAVEVGEPYDLELRLISNSDETIWLRIVARPQIELGRVTSVTGNIIDITERKRVDADIRSLAFCDSLTGLPNRRLLLDRLHVALAASARSAQRGAVLFIDLDNFKSINDTLGHEAGDTLLQQVAARLQHCVREGDTVARIGGDEFVVMLDRLDAEFDGAAAQAATVAEKVLAHLREDFSLGTHSARCTPSIGIAVFDGTTPSEVEILRQADTAMYQAKAAGRNAMAFHAPGGPNAAPQAPGSPAAVSS